MGPSANGFAPPIHACRFFLLWEDHGAAGGPPRLEGRRPDRLGRKLLGGGKSEETEGLTTGDRRDFDLRPSSLSLKSQERLAVLTAIDHKQRVKLAIKFVQVRSGPGANYWFRDGCGNGELLRLHLKEHHRP